MKLFRRRRRTQSLEGSLTPDAKKLIAWYERQAVEMVWDAQKRGERLSRDEMAAVKRIRHRIQKLKQGAR